MKAEYRPGRKSATIILSDVAAAQRPWSVAIQRESDQKYYTSTDYRHWLPEENFALMEAREMPDGNISVAIAPDLAVSLNPRDKYIVWLRAGDGTKEQALLTPAGPRSKPGADSGKAALPVSPNSSNRILRRAVIILLVFACLAWFWLDARGPEDSLFPPPPPPIVLPRAEDYTPAEAVKRAEELIKGSEKDREAAFALYRYAATNREKSAFLPYAACLDPSLPRCGTAQKNSGEAENYYRQAPDQEAADAAMTHMRDWLGRQGQDGVQ